jgi:hypothetical protein
VTSSAHTDRSERRFEAFGFGLTYESMPLIGLGDVVVATAAGAGSSLLGNILRELDLHYVDLTKEALLPDGSSVPADDEISRRLRPGASFDRERARRRHGRSDLPRFMKTHLPAEEFVDCTFGGVWILVRDPRDAMYSLHRYHRSFAVDDWEHVPESFEEFLRRPFFAGPSPIDNWTSFHAGWLERAESCDHAAVIRFEDLKRDPVPTMRAALASFGLELSDDELARAVEASSYEAMRAHEDAVVRSGSAAPTDRIVRKGKVGEWKDWMTPELGSYFSREDVRAMAARFDYAIPAGP